MVWRMPAHLTLRFRCSQVLLAVAVLLLGSSAGTAADPDSSAPARVKIAARSVDADPAGFALGRPVIVTRADLESPLGRIRGLEADTSASGPVRQADPAFKAILLTPRDSTGRPAQPILPDVVLTEPEIKQTTAEPDSKQESGIKLGSHNVSDPVKPLPNAQKERTIPRPSTQQSRNPKEVAAAPPRATAPRVPARAAATATAPRFGAAEIAATRAFTRF